MVAGPTVPPPPALLSITIGWPMNFDALSAIARIEISVEPPAGHGTISVIGLVGYSCARTGQAEIAAAITAIAKRLRWNIKSSPDASRVDRGAALFSVAAQSTIITTALQAGACGITCARLT